MAESPNRNEENPPTVMVDGGRLAAEGSRLAPAVHLLVPVEQPDRSMRVGDDALLIGRAAPCELRIDDPSLSSRHCQLRMRFGLLWVEDLGSTNGTFIDGHRISRPSVLRVGATLQAGLVQFRHELRDERSVSDDGEWSVELAAAARYITELLPEPWRGRSLDIGWRLAPCRTLGGDSFGYRQLDDGSVAIYLIDVCGHGLRAALHSVAILNALRKRADDDERDPGRLLTALNRDFPMETHGGMFFTMWYGVIDPQHRRVRYSSAGHPPALVRAGSGGPCHRLSLRRPPIGTLEGISYATAEHELPADSTLYLFSDGVIEELGRDGRALRLPWLEATIAALGDDPTTHPERIESALREATGAHRFADDFTLLAAHAR